MWRRKRWLLPSPRCTARCGSAPRWCCSQNRRPIPQIHQRRRLVSPFCTERGRRPSEATKYPFADTTLYYILHACTTVVWKKGEKYHLARVRQPDRSTLLQGILLWVWFKGLVSYLMRTTLTVWTPGILLYSDSSCGWKKTLKWTSQGLFFKHTSINQQRHK